VGQTVSIIGDGAMATTCALLLSEKGYAVRMWGAFPEYIMQLRQTRENSRYLPGVRLPDGVQFTADDNEAFAGAFLIVSAVPCQYLRSVWTRLLPHAPRNLPIVSVTKGIEVTTLQRPTQVIRDVLGDVPVVALSGPNIASELARRMPATVTAASEDLDLAQRVQEVFSTSWFRVYTNDDVVGVELAAAMKNVIALAAGGLDGMQLGSNAKAALLTRGLAEIARLGIAMGAKRETFAGLSGLGDLVTTCISPASRNRTAGEKICRGQDIQEVLKSTSSVVEGVPTTQAVVKLARQYGVPMPITETVHAILFEGKNARQMIGELMGRQLKRED
jgi:glycerol-3-phosphate dehydrogenase (NAD(P)+)